eukprot:TRINITY_DN77855_c0_g1_i1.p1 TRINITY_DN77855_c0_g1~~TRINITY_DN77855_c0_g1_i1.p1  ORF type:complete len:249 (-),score=57.26 TRINITY_DN77855_c0_g1_i1:87-833(-)
MGCGASVNEVKPLTPEEEAELKDKLRDVLYRFEIKIADVDDVMVLRNYELVVIADDSGSMREPAEGGTRWDELKATVSLIVEIGACFDESGVDIHFLNRGKVERVKSSSDSRFVSAFKKGPAGSTPLAKTLHKIVADSAGGKPELFVILTDGLPDEGSAEFQKALSRAVSKGGCKIQIMACTSDDSAVGYLDEIDQKFEAIDVTDDYHTEKKQVENTGKLRQFNRGDWCMKALLGPVCQKFDAWDEKK